MGFKFEKPQKARKEAKAAEEAQLTDHQKSYRDREKREEKRFQMAVDSGFWICFCFHDAEERGRFADLVKADAILKAFESLEVKPYYDNVWSSAYYVVCVFRNSDDLESFIREYALAKYGDLYMDGSKILEALEALEA